MKQTYYILAIIIFLLSGCKKDEIDLLAPPTQVGANTFGCLIDGCAFVPKGQFPIHQRLVTIYDGSTGWFNIVAKRVEDGNVRVVSINIDTGLYSPGVYTLYNKNSYRGSVSDSDSKSLCTLSTNSNHVGELNITFLDTTNRIIAGTFWFSAINYCGTKQVTDGRFDVKY